LIFYGFDRVKYLVVGDYAVSIHGYPGYTGDLDVCIESSEENAEKMVDVINDFGLGSLSLRRKIFLKKTL
jgi:hypothetical protein